MLSSTGAKNVCHRNSISIVNDSPGRHEVMDMTARTAVVGSATSERSIYCPSMKCLGDRETREDGTFCWASSQVASVAEAVILEVTFVKRMDVIERVIWAAGLFL